MFKSGRIKIIASISVITCLLLESESLNDRWDSSGISTSLASVAFRLLSFNIRSCAILYWLMKLINRNSRITLIILVALAAALLALPAFPILLML